MTKSILKLFGIALVAVSVTFLSAQETPPETPAAETPAAAEATAAPEPAAPEPAPEPLPPIDPQKSFSRLAHPSVATRVHLTDEQVVQVQRLLAERAQKLAQAPFEKMNEIAHENEKKLEAILTPPQRAMWDKVFSEKMIRPIFKFQSWEQVLTWTAEQVGLQLVMDAPPPGTFDYAADREYTPTEYLDMLNGVLLRKGYTLVRYQKMLMLFNLARGKVPAQFLPKTKPESLGEYGSFELVACTFSLERRDQAAALQEMVPFQGVYFSYIPMPGNSLLVTDTAGNLQVLWKVAEAVKNPPPPEKPVPPKPQEPPPPPVWEAYHITGVDMAQAEKIIKEFVGDAKSLRLENSTEIHYNTQPGNHAAIKMIVDIINKDGSAVKRRSVVAYTLEPMRMSAALRGFRQRMNQWQQGGMVGRDEAVAAATNVVDFLKKSFPSIVVLDQPVMGKIVVFAEDSDHTKIRELFESLAQQTEPPAESKIDAKVYKLPATASQRSVSEMSQAIAALIPSATVSGDSSQGILIVVGTAAEHELVAATFRELETLADQRTVATYSTANIPNSQVYALVSQSRQDGIFASSLLVPDTQRRRLIVFGTEKQHAEIVQLLGQPLTAEEITRARDAIVYAPTVLSPYTLAAIVRDMFPELEVSRDDDRIVVRGTSAEVAEVRTLLEKLDQGDSGRQEPKTYPLKNADPYAIMRMINRLYQDATASYDYTNRSVMVEASRTTHEKIVALLASLDPDEPSPNALEVKFYPLYTRPTETLLSPLRQIVPAAQIVSDTRGKQIMVVARPSEHKHVAEHLAKILESFSVPEEPVLQVYGVTIEQRRRLGDFISSARVDLPTLQIIYDATPGQMSVWATPKEHELISTILNKFAESVDENPVVLRVFLFSTARKISTAESLIAQRYPDVRVFNDSAPRRLFVWGPPSTLEKIAEVVESLDGPQDNVSKVYPAIGTTMSSLQNAILELYPAIKLTYDYARQQILVWGSEEQHEQITAVVNLLNASESGDRMIRRFVVNRAEPYAMISMVYRLYPSATPSYDSLNRVISVEASPLILDKIAALFVSLDPDEPSPNAPTVQFYSLYTKPTETFLAPLRQIVPAAQIVPDLVNKQIMVIARPVDQKLLADNLKTILDSFTIPEEPILQIYHVSSEQHRRLNAFITTARTELPTVQVVADTTPGQMSIWATPKEHELLATASEEFAANEVPLDVRTYGAIGTTVYALHTAILELYPMLKISPDYAKQHLFVWATTEQHTQIDKLVKQLNASETGDREVRRFAVRNTEPYSMISMVYRLYPSATPTCDYLNRVISVEASPVVLDKIAALLKSLDPDEPSPNALTVKFHSLYTKPTETFLAPLRQIVPAAQIVPDVANKQIMVIARPADQKLLADNLETILASFTIPEEPILQIYRVSSEQQRRLNAFITTARAELPTVQVVADTTPGQMSIWATPKEHELLDTIVTKLAESEQESPMRLKVFTLSASDLATTQQLLAKSHPNADIIPDSQRNRLFVWAPQEVIDDVAATLDSQEESDGRKLFAYPAVGTTTVTLASLVRTVYPSLKIVEDTRRLLVWATPTEHVRIGEIIEQANAAVLGDPNAELAEKFEAYTFTGMDALAMTKMIEAFLPNVHIESNTDAGSIVILARSSEHERIRELIEQIKTSDINHRYALRAYPYGESNPVMLEAYLRGAFPDAESFTADDLVYQLSSVFAYQRFWSVQSQLTSRTTKKKSGFFKVDLKSRSVYAYLADDEHTLIAKSIEEIAAVTSQEASKIITRRYVLEDTSFYEVQELFNQVAPSAMFRAIYVPTGRGSSGYRDWSSSYRDFLAHATDADQTKIEQLVSELNEATSTMGRRELIVLTLPGGGRIDRAKVLDALTRLYPTTDPAAGTEPNQITLWARSHFKERIQSVFTELCRDIPEDQRAFIKSYPLKYIPSTQAVKWIKDLCPNASIEAGGAARTAMDPSVRTPASVPNSHTIIALATKGDHSEITKALTEIDIPLTSDVEPTPKVYDLSDLPLAYLFYNVVSLRQAIPGIVVLGSGVPGNLVIWATDDEHRKVESVLRQVITESAESRSKMEIYTLANGFTKATQNLIELIAPNAILADGTQLNQLLVWAKPSDQAKVKAFIDRLQSEEASRDVAFYPVPRGLSWMVYATVRDFVSYRGMAADISYDYTGDRLMVVASAEEQETIKKLIGEVGTRETDFEVFTLQNIDLESAQMALTALYSSESYYTRPVVQTDAYSTTIFVQGTKPQIEAARKTLVKMGETHLLDGDVPPTNNNTSSRNNSGQIRVIRLEGNVANTLRELERIWPQMSASPLVIQRESRPLIQKKENGNFSVPDSEATAEYKNIADAPAEPNAAEPKPATEETARPDGVYMTIGDDGSLTLISYDEEALDILEDILTRINNRIVDEGRDYTIYSVRNISAMSVYQKIQLVLRSRLTTRQQQAAAPRWQQQQAVIPLEIVPDLSTNTIYVRGSKADRKEVGRLIAMYDLSELPGERVVLKPIRVVIQNAEPYLIWQQVMNVYQQKIQSISLPGGVVPRITINQLNNALEIIAPEPLATELKEYAEELDKKIMTEPGRKIQVIPLEVKGTVIRQAIQVIRQSQSGSQMGGGVMMPGMRMGAGAY